MFERFTDRARRVVVFAQEEARGLSHDYIGTEHLLLGLAREGAGVAAQALEALGAGVDDLRAEVVAIVGEGERPPGGHIPFTPRAKKVLELSLREALELGHNYIGTEHVLLGLLREGEGAGAQVLAQRGADLDQMRQRVLGLLSDPGREPPSLRRRVLHRVRPGAASLEPEEIAEVGLERLTDEALGAVLMARAEVRRLGRSEVEPEHLFVGVATTPGPAAGLLSDAGLDLEALRGALTAVRRPSDPPAPPVPALSAATWAALNRAADRGGAQPVDGPDLLEALLATSTGVRLLARAAGVDLDQLEGRG